MTNWMAQFKGEDSTSSTVTIHYNSLHHLFTGESSMSWVQVETMLMICGLKGLEGALHMTGSHLSAFEGFYVFTSIQWSTLLRARECCSVHPRPGRIPTHLQQHAKKSVEKAKIGPDPQLVETCCQCKHFCYWINEGSREKANFSNLANAPPRTASSDVSTHPAGFPVAAGVSPVGDWPTQRSHTQDKTQQWCIIYIWGANVS